MLRSALILLASALLWDPGHAAAADREEAVAFIHKFAQAANGTDREAYGAFCAEDAVFTDHVPPYIFRGPRACQDEWNAAAAWIEKNKLSVSDYGTLGEPAFVDVTGDRVYAVFPVTAQVTLEGKRQVENGVWTFVVRRQGQAWRISSVTWSTLGFAPATAASEGGR